MILFKLLGAAILFGSGVGVSALVCEKKGRVLLEIQSFTLLFRHLRREIECYRRTIPMALTSLPEETVMGCLGAKRAVKGDLVAFIDDCPMQARGLGEIVSSAARELGKGNLAEQLRILDGAVSSLERLYQNEEKSVRQEQGTARAACLGLTAFAVILLI